VMLDKHHHRPGWTRSWRDPPTSHKGPYCGDSRVFLVSTNCSIHYDKCPFLSAFASPFRGVDFVQVGVYGGRLAMEPSNTVIY
jgi:hypothetical protein